MAPILVSSLLLAACSGGDTDQAVTDTTLAPATTDGTSTDGATDDSGDETPAVDEPPDGLRSVGRVDLQGTGNRVIDGPGDLLGGPRTEVAFDAEPRWIVPAAERGEDESGWLVVDADGATHFVTLDGEVRGFDLVVDPDLGPPLRVRGETIPSPDVRLIDFDDPLPDSRVVGDVLDRITVALIGPTDAYPHGVLGDRIEASGFGVAGGLDAFTATKINVLLDPPDVVEGVSPMLADVDDDQIVEVIVTVSNPDDGARIAAYEIDGTLVAETPPIGTGNRWRNQLAVAPIGPDGEVELIDVATPHLGGTLGFFRRDGERFERVASLDGYSTHSIGSRNLDLGIVTDADGDGRLDVVLPTDGFDRLHVVRRSDDAPSGAEVVGELALPARLTTNVAAQTVGADDGERVIYALGTADGTLLLIG